jgi:hypothetical protein
MHVRCTIFSAEEQLGGPATNIPQVLIRTAPALLRRHFHMQSQADSPKN